MSLGKMFMSAVVADGSVYQFIKYGKIDHLFKANEVEIFAFVKDFIKKHGKVPSSETIEKHTDEELTPHKEPASYYHELLVKRHIEQTLKTTFKQAMEHLGEVKDPEKAMKITADAVMQLTAQKFGHMISDFREAYGLIIGDYANKMSQDESNYVRFGYPTLDGMSGGVTTGDVTSMVGRPALGKTWWMLNTAMHGWNMSNTLLAQGMDVIPQSRLFLSMEMPSLEVQTRMAAMQAHVPIKKLDMAELSTKYMKKLKGSLLEIQGYGAPFWVVDGNLATHVEDLAFLVMILKPHGVWVDGGYLMKHPTEKDRYRRVAENSNLLKQNVASQAPLVVSWQFAKSASKDKKKKGEKVTGDDVAYSDAIFQDASLLLGLLEPESVETLIRRKIDILKGRKGQIGSFETNWDHDKMDFSEVVETDVEDLQYL